MEKRRSSSRKRKKNPILKNKHDVTQLFIICIVVSVLISALFTYTFVEFTRNKEMTKEHLIKEFYEVETATHVSPHHIRKHMAQGDDSFLLVDLRSQEEYEEEHIAGAINIPAYKNKDQSDYGAVERITYEFSQLPKDRDIIVYCYSTPCMTGRKVGKILADRGIYVKHLGIGWNEWKYGWETWNHPHEWETTNPEDYIQSGPSPGVPQEGLRSPVCVAGGSELGC